MNGGILSLYQDRSERREGYSSVYFFIVHTVEDGIEKEVGKLIAPTMQVDDVIETWTLRNHETVGGQRAKDISWRVLLKRLGVQRERLEEEAIINLTVES